MPLIQKTDAACAAEAIDAEAGHLATYATASLNSIYSRLTKGGDPQAVFDELGPKAAPALMVYAKFYEALSAAGQLLGGDPTASLAAPDLSVFVPQPDGRVLYVAPPQPDPKTEPAQ